MRRPFDPAIAYDFGGNGMSTETVLTDEQIRDLHVWDMYDFARAIEQAVLQSPEVQALRKDAERFEFLRDNALLFSQIEQRGVSGWMVGRRDHVKTRFYTYNGQELVEAIDAAMEKQP